MKKMLCLRLSVPVLLAVLGGLLGATWPADEPLLAADLRLDDAAYTASDPLDDEYGDHHEDAAASHSSDDGDYYQYDGYRYTYPEEQYGYDEPAGNDQEAAGEPPQGGSQQVTEPTTGETTGGTPEQAKEGSTEQYEYQYEYKYEDGYSSDDSEEVDEPSTTEPNDQTVSEWLDQWWWYEYGDGYEYEGDSSETSDTPAGRSTDETSTESPKESASDADQEHSARTDPSEYGEEYGYKHAAPESRYGHESEADESEGGPHSIEGAQFDAQTDRADGDDALDESADEEGWSDVVQRDPQAHAERNTSGPKMLGAVISVAARSLDRLGNALCAMSRQLEGLR